MQKHPRPWLFALLLCVPLLGGADECGEDVPLGTDDTIQDGTVGGGGAAGDGADGGSAGGGSPGDGTGDPDAPPDGSGGDAGQDPPASAEYVECGPNLCTAGLECCNPSCGICTTAGGFCTEQACPDAAACSAAECGQAPDAICPDGTPRPASCGRHEGNTCSWQLLPCPEDPEPEACQPQDCPSPAPGEPNRQCEDSDVVAGPACLRNTEGECVWQRVQCPGEPCGGIAGLACGDGQFCDWEQGEGCDGTVADASGVCAPVAGPICPTVFAPVCGCDGTTYDSRCHAHSAGVAVDHEGECDAQQCGTIAGLACDDGEFCNYEKGDGCGQISDAAGVCDPVPDGCDDVYEPVCGCDGEDYENRCSAHLAGVAVKQKGLCPVTPQECTDQGGEARYSDGASGAECEAGTERQAPLTGPDGQMPVEPALCCL